MFSSNCKKGEEEKFETWPKESDQLSETDNLIGKKRSSSRVKVELKIL